MWQELFTPRFYSTFNSYFGSNDQTYSVENLPVVCSATDFEPLSLFDGFPESAWCEGVDGEGIGEWIEFELTEDVLGLAIYNGFKKQRWFEWDEDFEQVNKRHAEFLNANNRVQQLEINSVDGEIKYTLNLADTYEKQAFDDIRLQKGSYRLVIRDIYKGNRWQDTCLGEVEFYSATAKQIVEGDEFLEKCMQKYRCD